MKIFIKSMLTIAASAIILAGIAITPINVLAWGDNEGGRDEYTIAEINRIYENGEWPKDKIVFNSISDSVIGHEFNFVAARECIIQDDGRANPLPEGEYWNGNDIDVEDGKTYIIRLYVHNNNPYGTSNNGAGVAENVKVSFNIPSVSSKQVTVHGFILSSNATPSEYFDYINFNSEIPFHLEYIYGSALLENNSIGVGGLTLSDDIVQAKSGGILIGYDALDGRIPGCFQYAGYVTIQVKVVFDYDYVIENEVRLSDSKDKTWHKAVEAKVGDKVEFLIGYYNTSGFTQTDVAIRDYLPNNLKYIEGSTKLRNSNHPDGVTMNSNALTDGGIKIGSYGSGANAYVMFTAKVVDKNLSDGTDSLVNYALGGAGNIMIEDSAIVHVVYGNGSESESEDDPSAGLPSAGSDTMAEMIIFSLLCLTILATILCKMQRWKKIHR